MEKQGRKRKREEANQEEKNKVPKPTVERKLFKELNNVECKLVCHVCKRKIKSGCELHCDDCQNLSNCFAFLNTTTNTFQFLKMATIFCVRADTKKNIQTTVQTTCHRLNRMVTNMTMI